MSVAWGSAVCAGGPLSGMSAVIVPEDGDAPRFMMHVAGGEYVLVWNNYLRKNIWRWVEDAEVARAAETDPVRRRVAARAQLTRARVRRVTGALAARSPR